MGKPIRQSRNELNGLLGRIDFFLAESARALRDEKVFADAAQKLDERDHPRAARRHRQHLGVELSVFRRRQRVRARARRRQRGALQAVGVRDADRACTSPTCCTRPAFREDVFVPVIGGGATGAALLRQPVDGVFFTGSYATGAKIAASAGKRMIKVQLELGGKDPIYVCDDVDVKAAAAAVADGAFYNTGQSCCSVERIYVHESVHDAFVDAFVAEVKGFKVGDPMDEATYIGPITRRPQLDVLEQQVADAQTQGRDAAGRRHADQAQGQLVRADRARRRRPLDARDARRELRPDHRHPGRRRRRRGDRPDERHRIRAHGRRLHAATRRARGACSSRVHAGSVYWNCCDRVSPRLPWSGVKHSGIGLDAVDATASRRSRGRRPGT